MNIDYFSINNVEIAIHNSPVAELVEIADSQYATGSVILNFKEMDFLIRAYEAVRQDKALESNNEQ